MGEQARLNAWGMPAPPSELERLNPLVGDWKFSSRTEPSILGPSVEMKSREQFYWLEGRYFLVQTYDTQFGDEPPQRGINYWYYDPGDGTFNVIFFSNNGNFTEEGNRYRGAIEGDRLVMVGPARFELALDSSGTVATTDGGGIAIDWWLRDGAGEFQPWMNSVLRRA
jgi:hypothetical protein